VDDVDYRALMDEIVREQQQAEKTELERLTQQALPSGTMSVACLLPVL